NVTTRLLAHLAQENVVVHVLQRNLANTQDGVAGLDPADLVRCMMALQASPTCGNVKERTHKMIAATFDGQQELVNLYRTKALPAENALAAAIPTLVFPRVLRAYGVSIAGFERGLEARKQLPEFNPLLPELPPSDGRTAKE